VVISQFNAEKSIKITIWLALRDKTGGGNWLMTGEGWEMRGAVTRF
jgi:hypothetical protein